MALVQLSVVEQRLDAVRAVLAGRPGGRGRRVARCVTSVGACLDGALSGRRGRWPCGSVASAAPGARQHRPHRVQPLLNDQQLHQSHSRPPRRDNVTSGCRITAPVKHRLAHDRQASVVTRQIPARLPCRYWL